VKTSVQPKRYVVRTGDSLWKIARSEWNSTDPALIRLLIQANPQLRNRDAIRAGWTLIIPPADGIASPARELMATVQPETNQVRWYTIRKNDSLARIAARELKNARRWPEIVKLNSMLDARKPIYPGTRIRLPAT
jgi:nucleoid-associated protein YgaU